MYSLLYSSSARKYLKKLPLEVKKRIIGSLERSRIRPYTHFIRLVDEKLYKLRVGDYRVIAEIHGDTLHILVVTISIGRMCIK